VPAFSLKESRQQTSNESSIVPTKAGCSAIHSLAFVPVCWNIQMNVFNYAFMVLNSNLHVWGKKQHKGIISLGASFGWLCEAQYIPKLWDKVLIICLDWKDVMQTTFCATEGRFLIMEKYPNPCLKAPDLTTLEVC